MASDEKSKNETRAQTQEILKAISGEIPMMIRNILTLVFSEDSGRTLGKAAAAYYKELRSGGIPENAAVRLTESYMQAFTNLADFALPKKLREMRQDRSGSKKSKRKEKLKSKK